MEGLVSTSKLIISLETHDGSLIEATEGLAIIEKQKGDDHPKVSKHASQVSTDNILLETCSTQTLDGGADEIGMFEDSSISTQATGLTNSAVPPFPDTSSTPLVTEKHDRDHRAHAKNRSKSESTGNAVVHNKKKKKPPKLSHSTRFDSNISIDGGASEHGLYDDSSIESEVLPTITMQVAASKQETELAFSIGESAPSETIQPPEALSSSPTLSRSDSNCKSTDSTKRTTNTEINPDEIDEREWLTANKGTTGPIDPPLEPPRAPLILKTESTLSIDGGAEERGMYDDSSISTQATELLVSQYDDNDYLLEKEKIGKAPATHPHHCTIDEEVSPPFTFSPDIAETQHTKHTPLNPRVHGKENMSVFQRLYGDSQRWQEHKQHIREDIQHTEEEELTFSPKTNIVHKSEQTSPKAEQGHAPAHRRIISYEKPHKVKADPSKEGKSTSHAQDTTDL